MKYITDYQLDINTGFQCKVDGKTFNCTFHLTSINKQYFIFNILNVADAIGISRQDFLGIFNSDYISNSIYCDSKQQCYDLCQHIVDKYFKPDPFTKNDEEFTVEIYGETHTFFLTKNGMFYWDSKTIAAYHFNDHISLTEVSNICYILKINKQKHHNGKIGFETKEDAIKFAKYVIQYFYPRKETKECGEKSRKHLLKYYDGKRVSICNHTFILKNISSDVYWQLDGMSSSSLLYTQFSLTDIDVEKICKSLNIHITWYQLILAFSNSQDAIKFTDYLIETYIIKKEKTYDTNQLRKKRTSVSREFEPAGSIIHGRRSKASIRCRHIEHKARIGC